MTPQADRSANFLRVVFRDLADPHVVPLRTAAGAVRRGRRADQSLRRDRLRGGLPSPQRPECAQGAGVVGASGSATPAESCERVRGHVTDVLLARTCVRYTSAGALRAAGFAVLHTPGRITAGHHCSVIYPAADPLRDQATPWPGSVRRPSTGVSMST